MKCLCTFDKGMLMAQDFALRPKRRVRALAAGAVTAAVIAAPVSAAQAAPSDDSEAMARVIDSSLVSV
ncbi:hypothetical protein GCM10025784_25810 [Citricoccus nitrophenolicus]